MNTSIIFQRLLLTAILALAINIVRLFFTSGIFEQWLSYLAYGGSWLMSGNWIVLPEERSARFGLAFMLLFLLCYLLDFLASDGSDEEPVERGRRWSTPPSQIANSSFAERIYRRGIK